MSPSASIQLLSLSLMLLYGCSVAGQSSSVASQDDDCSFRAATTCWTVAGRFPAPGPEAGDSVPTETLSQPPAVLASGVDTVSSHAVPR